MSLVDTATGEVVDVLDETTAETLAHEISLRFNQLNATAGELIELAHAAYIGRAWVALGFGSWEELCDEMRWDFQPRTMEERRPLVLALRQKGMSIRAIGVVMRSGYGTVARDIAAGDPSGSPELTAGVPSGTPDDDEPDDDDEPTEPATIVGQDGKQYPAARPTTAPSTEEASGSPVPAPDAEPVDGATLSAGVGTVSSITEPTAIAAPGAPAPADPTPEVEAALHAIMAGTPEEQARSNHLRRWYQQAAAWGPHDPVALAEAASYAATDLDEEIESFVAQVARFAGTYRQARRSGLRVLEGGRR